MLAENPSNISFHTDASSVSGPQAWIRRHVRVMTELSASMAPLFQPAIAGGTAKTPERAVRECSCTHIPFVDIGATVSPPACSTPSP